MIRKIINYILGFIKEHSIFFVGSADKLPEPLSKEEETRYVESSMNGDKNAKNILIEHNLRLVVFLAKKYENTGLDLEDLVSIGTIGLIKGVNTYKLDKNIKLATYASRCIDNEILMFLRKNKKRRGEVSFEDSLSYDSEGNELHLEDILGTDSDIVTKEIENENDKKLFYKEIDKLNNRDKKIMILRYGLYNNEEMTQKDVANLLGIVTSITMGTTKLIILFVLIFIQSNVVPYVIQPKIYSSKIDLSIMWVLFGILTGSTLFGAWGMIIAMPILVTIKISYRVYRQHNPQPKNA